MTVLADFATFRAQFATSATTGPDGYEVWPVALVRAASFDAGLTGIARPIAAFPLTVSCNAQAADGGAAFDWYLSQRTDDTSLQYMTIGQYSVTQSGTVRIALTAFCVSDLGLASVTSPVNEDQLRRILAHCTLYVRRKSDGAIQLVEMLPYTLSAY